MKLNSGEVCLWNSTKILGHDWPVEFANQGERKFETFFQLFIKSFGGPEQRYLHYLVDVTEVKLHLQYWLAIGNCIDDWVICLCNQTRS